MRYDLAIHKIKLLAPAFTLDSTFPWDEAQAGRLGPIIDVNSEAATFQEKFPSLNTNQRQAFEAIRAQVDPFMENFDYSSHSKAFFLQGPAGTGKTFLYETLAAYVRMKGHTVLCVASSGIAATLLPHGSTAHSRFKIPLQTNITSVCNIPKNSMLAAQIKQTALILWDEGPMMASSVFETVDRSLRDITNSDTLFGGIPFLVGGDFRQTLPASKQGTKADILSASLFNSRSIWPRMTKLELTENYRVRGDNSGFVRWLEKVGNGDVEGQPLIDLHNTISVVTSQKQLLDRIFGNLTDPKEIDEAVEFYTERVIICPRNDQVMEINNALIGNFIPSIRTHFANSFDELAEGSIDNPNIRVGFPPDVLQGLIIHRTPPGHLRLKRGMPVLLLRNICPEEGLCNGTRLIILETRTRLLECLIISRGKYFKKFCTIPRIPFINPVCDGSPISFKRTQFPVVPCFAMTINKSQGQTLKTVGVDLTNSSVFAHGQLYVALSRVTSPSNLTVAAPPSSDSN